MNEFKEWLSRNAGHLSAYQVDEVVNVAIAAGFSRQVVAQWATSERFKGVA